MNSPETNHRLTKFGTINQFMEMNFGFNEKHKKSKFCGRFSERSIHLKLLLPTALKKDKRKCFNTCD